MRFRSRVAVLAVIFSVFCGYVGFTAGAPVPNGPCKTDATNTCAFTCIPNAELWVKSDDATKVPYCDNSNQVKCDNKAQAIDCHYKYYSNATCTTFVTENKFTSVLACK